MNSDLQSIFFTEIIQNSCNDTDELILQHLITMHFALKIVPWAQTYLLSFLIELRLRSSEKVNRPQEYPSWRFLTGSAFTNCAVQGHEDGVSSYLQKYVPQKKKKKVDKFLADDWRKTKNYLEKHVCNIYPYSVYCFFFVFVFVTINKIVHTVTTQ